MSAPVGLDVHLLGQSRLCVDGVPIKFAKRAITIPMLAYVILQRGRAVPRETLAFTLFPEHTESEAFKELRRYLHLAHKALPETGGPWLEADGETVRWNERAAATIDVFTFERLAAVPATLRAAVEQYEGDLLPEIYDDWVLAERERLRTTYLGALSTLVVQARSARDFPAAIVYAQRLLAHDPWREDIVRHLIAVRYEMGDAAGAVAEYERFAAVARDELQVEPMPETRALRDSIVRSDALPSSLDRGGAGFEARQRQHALPFEGRRREFERLRHAWERAARAKGGIVALEGEPGIGKSRLAAEFALLAESEGGRVLAGTTASPELVPYQSILEALRAGLPFAEPLRPEALRTRILAQVLPELRAAEASADLPGIVAEHQRGRLFDAIGATLAGIARSRPLCVILEDVHWAGNATLELVRTLARRAAASTLLIVITLRDEEVPPEHPLRVLLRDLGAEGLALRVPLARLTRDDVAAVIGALAEPVRTKLDAPALFAQSEGNPLLLSAAIAEALETDAEPSAARGVANVIMRRLDRLTPSARRLAAVAAVCGTAFDADVVCSAAGTAGAEGLALFDELFERHIVREAGSAAGFSYVFGHHLIATVLYDALAPDDRAARHARVARALERFHHDRLDARASEIARHYAAAGERETAAHWYARAAHGARAIFAHEEAARFASLALDGASDATERMTLLLLREEAHARLGRRTDALRDLDQIDRDVCDGAIRCESLRRRIVILHSLDDRDAERAAILALRAAAHDDRWAAVADGAEAMLELALGHCVEAEPLAQAAVERLAHEPAPTERLGALSVLVEVAVATGRPDVAEARLREAQTIAEESRDDRILADVLAQSVSAAIALQQFERAFTQGQRAATLYHSIGDAVAEAGALVSSAAAAARLSRWEAARDANLRAAATFALADDRRGLARVLMNLAMLHGRFADFEQARSYLVQAREHQRRLQDDRAVTASLLNESFLASWQQRPSEGYALAHQALELAEQMNHINYRAAAISNLGTAERDLGQLDRALVHMEEGLAQIRRLGNLPNVVTELAETALTHAMAGDLTRAMELVETLLTIDRDSINATIYPPYTPWAAARILHAKGDPRARQMLDWAVALADSHSASIDVPALRTTFLNLPFLADVRAAAADGVWPPLGSSSERARDAARTAG